MTLMVISVVVLMKLLFPNNTDQSSAIGASMGSAVIIETRQQTAHTGNKAMVVNSDRDYHRRGGDDSRQPQPTKIWL